LTLAVREMSRLTPTFIPNLLGGGLVN